MAEVLIPCDHEVATGDTLQEIHGPWRISSVHKDARHRSDSIKYEVHIQRSEHQTTDRLLKKAFASTPFETLHLENRRLEPQPKQLESQPSKWRIRNTPVLIPPGSSATRKCMSPGACEVIGAMCVARRSTIDVSKSVKNASQSMKKIQSLDANGAATPTACALHTRWLQDLGSVYYSTIFDSYPNKAISKFIWGHIPAPPLFRSWLGQAEESTNGLMNQTPKRTRHKHV